MNCIRFPGVNVNYGAPIDWNEERDGPCGVLPVLRGIEPETGLLTCTSVWELTPEERLAVAAGANIALNVVGVQPPVSLFVTPLTAEQFQPSA